MNNQSSKDQISSLAYEIIQSLSTQPSQPETQVKLQAVLEKRISSRLLRIIIDNADQQVIEKAQNELTDQTTPAQSLEILAKYIPDFEQKVILGLAGLHNEIKQDLQDLVDLFQKLEESPNH